MANDSHKVLRTSHVDMKSQTVPSTVTSLPGCRK